MQHHSLVFPLVPPSDTHSGDSAGLIIPVTMEGRILVLYYLNDLGIPTYPPSAPAPGLKPDWAGILNKFNQQ